MTKPEQEPKAAPEQAPEESPKTYDLSKPGDVFRMFGDKLSDDEIKSLVSAYIQTLAIKHGASHYKIIFLCDEHTSIDRYDANALYRAVSINPKTQENQPSSSRTARNFISQKMCITSSYLWTFSTSTFGPGTSCTLVTSTAACPHEKFQRISKLTSRYVEIIGHHPTNITPARKRSR